MKGLSSLMVAGFLVHRTNADVEVVSVESSLNTVHTATDRQDRQCIPVVCVCLVLLVAMLMMVGLDCCCDYVCRGWSGYHGKRESLGSVPNAVSPASKAGPRMPMRDMPEHEKETERARRGHSLTLHVDVVTLCGSERQTREEQWLRNEAATGGLAVHLVLGELEPRLRSWMTRPSTPGVMKE